MSRTDLLCLNRIIKPQIPLEEFLKFTADLGIKFVEVRNDFTDKGILDGLSDAALQKAFKDTGVKALTINALYPFEDAKVLKDRAVDPSGATIDRGWCRRRTPCNRYRLGNHELVHFSGHVSPTSYSRSTASRNP